MQVQREGRRVRVRMAKGWANAQPQALYLLGEEARAWTKLGLVELQVEA